MMDSADASMGRKGGPGCASHR